MCATARLFIDHMLPDVDAGIFLDTDILLMDNIKVNHSILCIYVIQARFQDFFVYCRYFGTISRNFHLYRYYIMIESSNVSVLYKENSNISQLTAALRSIRA